MNDSSTPVAYIIGGTTGMGKATAAALTAKGIPVTVVARDTPRLTAVGDAIGAPELVTTIGADLYNPAAVETLVARIDSETRPIGYLVNAAGTFNPKPFIDHGAEDYDAYMGLNRATFFVTQAVVRNMIKHGGGSIVNIGSMWAKQAIKATPSSAYSMAKAGLHSFTQHLAMELGDNNIRVNAVSPAVVETPIYENFIEPDEVHDTLQGFSS